MGIFDKFKLGFKKSASNIASGLREIIVKKEIDDNTLDKIEEFLISSDVGVDASSEIKDIIAQKKIDPKNDPIEEVNKILSFYITDLMKPLEKKSFFEKKKSRNVILVSGVNGVGKTTTIGKIGKIFKEADNKVLFSACDTFRAAAIEQLEKWSEKIGVDLVKSEAGSDPASVAYKAMEHAKNNQIDQIIHLGAQAGVRYSISNPQLYIDTNITGFLNILENSKNYKITNIIYASSSSIYGINEKYKI